MEERQVYEKNFSTRYITTRVPPWFPFMFRYCNEKLVHHSFSNCIAIDVKLVESNTVFVKNSHSKEILHYNYHVAVNGTWRK